MRALLIFLAFIAAATAQSSFDPYQFIRKKDLHNADVSQFWRMLGISGKIRETTTKGSKDTDESFNCGPDDKCEAELIRSHWSLFSDGDAKDVVVRISPSPFGDLRRFLVLHRIQAGWRLVDYLDSTNSHYEPAAVSVVNSGGKRWLVVNSYPRCGTGCGLDYSNWFELKNGKLKMILTVPLSGDEISENPGRYFKTRFVRASQSGDRETLEFVFDVEFSSGSSRIEVDNLWSEGKIIRFFPASRARRIQVRLEKLGGIGSFRRYLQYK